MEQKVLLGKAENYSEQLPPPQHTAAWLCPRQFQSYHVCRSSSGHGPSTWANLSSREPASWPSQGRDGTKELNGILIRPITTDRLWTMGQAPEHARTPALALPPHPNRGPCFTLHFHLPGSLCMGETHTQIGPASERETPAQQSPHSCQRGKSSQGYIGLRSSGASSKAWTLKKSTFCEHRPIVDKE